MYSLDLIQMCPNDSRKRKMGHANASIPLLGIAEKV